MRAGKAGQGCAKWGKGRREWARAVRQEWEGMGGIRCELAEACSSRQMFYSKKLFLEAGICDIIYFGH